MDRQRYEFLDRLLDTSHDFRPPQLVLGIDRTQKIGITDEPVLTTERSWLRIQHQTAGHACHQRYVLGTILTPAPGVREKMERLCSRFLDSDIGFFHVSLENVLDYRGALHELFGKHVDCNLSYWDFEEAIYPIDCTEDALKTLTAEPIPDPMMFQKATCRRDGGIGFLDTPTDPGWTLYILGENCD